ncbi:MAG: TatD family hydrolase [Eubacteriales bacterium]
MIYDGHTHIWTPVSGKDLGEFEKDEVSEFKKMFSSLSYSGIVNSTNENEFYALKEIVNAYVSFGIHPWQADKFTEENYHKKINELSKIYKEADAIGEIGLDSVWCDCTKEEQMRIFTMQLDMANEFKKPIILHLKGMEKEGLNEIKKYDFPKMIHWYSYENLLDEFINCDCYFTVGIDVLIDKQVSAQIAQAVPLDRLLLETDGTEAVEWGIRREVMPFELPDLLKESLAKVAKIRDMDEDELADKIEENFFRFLKG